MLSFLPRLLVQASILSLTAFQRRSRKQGRRVSKRDPRVLVWLRLTQSSTIERGSQSVGTLSEGLRTERALSQTLPMAIQILIFCSQKGTSSLSASKDM